MAEKNRKEELEQIEDRVRTIGVLTSGGDAPGMNAAIRAVVRTAIANGIRVCGIRRGYHGLLKEEIIELTARDVADTIQRGGTILQTARCQTMRTEEGQQKAAAICKKYGIDGLVVIGGDGSFAGAQKLANLGVRTIGLPGTIDLDIACTDYTIGFDTAVNTAMEAIDKVRDTSTSHERCSIIEVMGRGAGYLALWCGIANGAEKILLPEEHDYDEQSMIDDIMECKKRGKKNYIIINAEGVGDSINMAKRIVPCAVIRAAIAARPPAVTITPTAPARRRTLSSAGKNFFSDIKTRLPAVIYAGKRVQYACVQKNYFLSEALSMFSFSTAEIAVLVKRIFTRSAPVSRTKVSSLIATTRPMTPPMVVT